jgi:hypothetical protein
LSVAPRRFVGKARVSYTLSEAATVIFKLRFRASGRVLRSGFARRGHNGKNHFTFSSRIKGQKLRPATYDLVATAKDAGGTFSKRARAKFTIVKP